MSFHDPVWFDVSVVKGQNVENEKKKSKKDQDIICGGTSLWYWRQYYTQAMSKVIYSLETCSGLILTFYMT